MKLLHLLLCLLLALPVSAQESKDLEKLARQAVRQKTAGIGDRAGGSHNKSNIGLFFENRGKLYPAEIAQGVGGEWPLHSGHEYIYRANPVVGVPRNVVQGRFRGSEEWEAAPGYNSPGSAKIAFSDDPASWPPTGWLVKGADGKPAFVSDQDSYCAYHDSLNTRPMLQVQVDQIGYAFGMKTIKDMLFFTYKVINKSPRTLDSLYWGLYVDIDIGDVPGGVQEYADDKVGIDRGLDLVYFYDDGTSAEWPGANTGYFGYTLVSAPPANGVMRGITDFHYSLYNDDSYLLQDTVHYGVLSSAASLYNSTLGKKYFHPGANLPDLHFDDPATVPPTGLDLVSNIGVGPYTLKPGDTLTFVTAFVAGYTLDAITTVAQRAHALHASGYATQKAPDPPNVVVEPGDRKVRITWDNRSESSRNIVTGQPNFEGYRLYKSTDKGVHWDQYDRNTYPALGPDPVPLAVFDRKDNLGPDYGLQYSYVDSTVINGFEYWYTVTAFDIGDSSVGVLESPKGTTIRSTNLGIAIPRSAATGLVPISISVVSYAGTGAPRVNFTFQPVANAEAGGKTFETSFAPVALLEAGNTRSTIEVFLDTLKANSGHLFGVVFTSPTGYLVRDLTAKTVIDSGSYSSGTPIRFAGLRLLLTDSPTTIPGERPEKGDSIVVRSGITVMASGTNVLPLRPFAYGTWYATTNGVVFQIALADTVPSSAVNYGDLFRYTTEPARVDPALVSNGLSRVKVVPNPYMISSVFETEYGTRGERREPIRQLKFNNLPPKCTITIYTMAGDLVSTLYHESDNGTENWNMRSAGGREIAAGVYVYIVKTDNAQKIDRFAVIK